MDRSPIEYASWLPVHPVYQRPAATLEVVHYMVQSLFTESEMSVLVGKQAPDFEATAVMPNNSFVDDFKLSDYRGKYVVLFFWPLDFTFVCPSEIIAHHNRL